MPRVQIHKPCRKVTGFGRQTQNIPSTQPTLHTAKVQHVRSIEKMKHISDDNLSKQTNKVQITSPAKSKEDSDKAVKAVVRNYSEKKLNQIESRTGLKIKII